MRIQENTLDVTIPDGRAFRLQDCDTFVSIRGDTPHDFDVAWQNAGDERLWLVEFKDYGELIPTSPNQGHLETNLADKIKDTLYVLASVWAASEFGRQLRSDIESTFPNFPRTACPIRPVVILNLERRLTPLFSQLMTALNTDQNLMSVLSVMDIERILVVSPDHPFVREQLQIDIQQRIP